MSEQTAEGAETEPEATSTDEEQKPTETVEFWKQKAREQEKRAKDNASAAKRLTELEEAGKSELERANGKATAAETERDDARAEALRLRVAVEHGIGLEDADLFLTGRDEETLRAQAKRLSDREAERKKQGNHVPNEGRKSNAADGDDRTAVRAIFGGD